MTNKIKLIDSESQVLYEFAITDSELAYAKAFELESMGIEVNLVRPSLPESLAATLGMTESERKKLKEEIEDEIDSHNEKPTCGGRE